MSDTVTNPETPVKDESSLERLSIEVVAARCDEISTLPQVAMHVLEIARNPESGAADLRIAVEGDPALSARIVRSVNSAAFGLNQPVSSLHRAISLLGFGQVRNLALTASVSSIFQSAGTIGTYHREELWRHLVSVGLCARLVAVRSRLTEFEDAFLAGLLHDVGIVLIDQHAHEHFVDIIHALDGSEPLCKVEQRILGFDHTQLGNVMAEKWRFPEVVRAAIRYHHNSKLCKSPAAQLVRCVEVANVVCTIKGISSVGRKLVAAPGDAFRELGLSKDDVVVLAKDLDAEIAQNECLFEVWAR